MKDDRITLKNNVHDCALVFEGGGYRAAYTAGMANVLLEQDIYFDEVVGISAGASHAVDYLSRDQSRIHRSFIDLADKREAGGIWSFLHGHGFFNATYDYQGCVDDGYMPFDWDSFIENPAHIRIQAFERDTGRTVPFTRESMQTLERMMMCVRASSSLPGMMRPISINGQVMLDGGLGIGAGIPTHLAEMDGYHKIFFLATRPKGYRKVPEAERVQRLYKQWGRRYPYMAEALLTRWSRYNKAIDHLETLENEGLALVVRPDEMAIKSTTLNTEKLRRAYTMGHNQGVRELPQWEKFLFG